MPRLGPPAIALVCLLALSACTPRDILMGGGAAVGTAAMQERGMRGAASDYNLRLLINDAWFKASLDLYQRVSLLISQGRIVLIGRVPDEAMRLRAESLAQTAAGRAVTNRISVGPDIGLQRRLEDDALSARLEATLTFDRDVSALNYDVETRDGVVYLIGEARSESEQRRVIYLAHRLPGIRAVESFIALPAQALEIP
jgi:osmotically-inducible protein OsmY